MISLVTHSQHNRISHWHPANKLIFASILITLAFCQLPLALLGLLMLQQLVFIRWATKINFKSVTRILLIPIGFQVMALLPMILEINHAGGLMPFSILPSAIPTATRLIGRGTLITLTIFSCVLTMPLSEMVYVLKRLKLPETIIELIVLIYRNIQIFIQTAENIHQSQQLRMANGSLKAKYKATAMLLSRLLILSIYRADEQYNSLATRGMNDQWPIYFEPAPFSGKRLAWGLVFICITVCLWIVCYQLKIK
jgi:cobalt/nickel transport system permease protein